MKAATAWCYLTAQMLGWGRDAGKEGPQPALHPPFSSTQLLHTLRWDLSSSPGFQGRCLGPSSRLMVCFP